MAEYDNEEMTETPYPRNWTGGSQDFTVTHQAHCPRVWGPGFGPRDRETYGDPNEDDDE